MCTGLKYVLNLKKKYTIMRSRCHLIIQEVTVLIGYVLPKYYVGTRLNIDVIYFTLHLIIINNILSAPQFCYTLKRTFN